MPLTREDYIDKLMSIHQRDKLLNDLANQRRDEEEALSVEYNVNECNAKRSTLVKKYQDLQKPILEEIEAIKKTLAD